MKKKELTKNQIIDAAIELFSIHGIDRTSLAMIAKEVGITKPSIYYHFESREVLLEQVFERIFANYNFDQIIRVTECTKENFADQLYQGGLNMMHQNDENASIFLTQFSMIAVHDEKYQERVSKIEQKFYEGFVILMKKGVELEMVSADNLLAKAQMLSIILDGLMMKMPSQLEFKNIWNLAVNSVLLQVNK